MYKNKKILAVITARGGSKGLPGKNIRKLAGKPLICWTIKQALATTFIDKVIVSTDDSKIAAIAKKCGADVPFIRPKALATTSAKSIDVILHALNWLEKYNNQEYDLVILLQPTSPLRTTGDIKQALRLLFVKKAKVIVSVCKADHPPLWSNTLPPDLNMGRFIKSHIIDRDRQALPCYYRLNGAIYVSEAGYLKKHRSFLGKDTYAYIMDNDRSVDIDTIMDFIMAEMIMRQKMTGRK